MKHLSPEQISKLIAGTDIPEESHARECSSCTSEVERVREVLAMFRHSVRDWTDKQDHSEIPDCEWVLARARPSRRPGTNSLTWVLAAGLLAAIVAVPAYQNSREREAKAQAERDSQLIDAVKLQLSRRGPIAMEPLNQLMSMKDAGVVTDGKRQTGPVRNGSAENGGVR